MYESPFILSLKGVLETLLDILEKRFSESEAQTLKPALERIEEEQHLKQLLDEAIHVKSLDEFRRILTSSEHSARA